ncbi:hypothetical protein EDB89DRAFT_1912039 [Lactarius sanguifluus]|nr:hypothetical protein EDB89DRAFT_1912039 [Lactarius sanguifluus]
MRACLYVLLRLDEDLDINRKGIKDANGHRVEIELKSAELDRRRPDQRDDHGGHIEQSEYRIAIWIPGPIGLRGLDFAEGLRLVLASFDDDDVLARDSLSKVSGSPTSSKYSSGYETRQVIWVFGPKKGEKRSGQRSSASSWGGVLTGCRTLVVVALNTSRIGVQCHPVWHILGSRATYIKEAQMRGGIVGVRYTARPATVCRTTGGASDRAV